MIANLRSGWLPTLFRTFSIIRFAGLAAFVFFFALSMQAQESAEDDILRGDKQFNLYAYNLAVRSFEEALKHEPNNAYALGRMADCYVQLNQPEASLIWYERSAGATKPDANLPLRYGKALMLTGDYAGAKKWFQFYGETDATIGKHFADMCDYAQKQAPTHRCTSPKTRQQTRRLPIIVPHFWTIA